MSLTKQKTRLLTAIMSRVQRIITNPSTQELIHISFTIRSLSTPNLLTRSPSNNAPDAKAKQRRTRHHLDRPNPQNHDLENTAPGVQASQRPTAHHRDQPKRSTHLQGNRAPVVPLNQRSMPHRLDRRSRLTHSPENGLDRPNRAPPSPHLPSRPAPSQSPQSQHLPNRSSNNRQLPDRIAELPQRKRPWPASPPASPWTTGTQT